MYRYENDYLGKKLESQTARYFALVEKSFSSAKNSPIPIIILKRKNPGKLHTPRPRAALLMCLKKYSAIGKSAIGNYVVQYSKFILKTVLLEVSYSKND